MKRPVEKKIRDFIIVRVILMGSLLGFFSHTATALTFKGREINFSLDSIATWGKFPKFCVDTYRWGDKFFNGYDSTYVTGTGYKFNIKLRTESWDDFYSFDFNNGTKMWMMSAPSTSAGFYLTYLAVSVGYDINVGKYIGAGSKGRRRWNFQFSCMLFETDLYFISNNAGSKIRRLEYDGDKLTKNLDFNGINTSQWGIDLYYFFRHKKYSQAAAFNFSRIQRKSSWAPFAGFSFWRQKYNFNFSSLPENYLQHIPVSPPDYYYSINTHNYFLRGGIGYNWVINQNWSVGLSEALMFGYSDGYIQTDLRDNHTVAMLNYARASLVFNKKQWFGGAVLSSQIGIVGNRNQTLLNSVLLFEVSAGMRFNLW